MIFQSAASQPMSKTFLASAGIEVQWGIGYPLGEDSLLQESASEAIFSLRLEAQAFPDAAPKKPHFRAITLG
jgi:hypothetical protein